MSVCALLLQRFRQRMIAFDERVHRALFFTWSSDTTRIDSCQFESVVGLWFFQ